MQRGVVHLLGHVGQDGVHGLHGDAVRARVASLVVLPLENLHPGRNDLQLLLHVALKEVPHPLRDPVQALRPQARRRARDQVLFDGVGLHEAVRRPEGTQELGVRHPRHGVNPPPPAPLAVPLRALRRLLLRLGRRGRRRAPFGGGCPALAGRRRGLPVPGRGGFRNRVAPPPRLVALQALIPLALLLKGAHEEGAGVPVMRKETHAAL